MPPCAMRGEHRSPTFPIPRTGTAAEDDKTMLITASWEGGDVAVEVDEGCRSVDALRHTLAAAVPELDAEKVCLEIGGCAADDEAVCSLCEGSVVTVSATLAARAVAILRKERRGVDLSCFCDAARHGDMRLWKLYLDAEVRHRPGSDTPLHIACRVSNLPLCKLLIERGYPLDLQSGPLDVTALHYAASGANPVEVCRLLIDGGCSLDVQDSYRNTPLFHAIQANSVEVCRLLIDRGCSLEVPNTTGDTPLLFAARANFVEVCKLLIDGGCSLDLQNHRRRTPLHEAVKAKSVKACRLLIDRGCRLDIQDYDGHAPLHDAVKTNSVELCRLLIDGGCRLDVQNRRSQTPLHYAVNAQSVELCRLLLDGGAATNLTIVQRRSLFDVASGTGWSSIYKLLTDHGVSDPRAKRFPRCIFCCSV